MLKGDQAVDTSEFESEDTEAAFCLFPLQYVVVTVCLKAGLETTAWTRVSILHKLLFY